jgi:uncharacterized protein (TIGR02421 family)
MNDSILTGTLQEIDDTIDRLVRQIELLNYVNPTNIAEQKQRFFESKFTVNPEFSYPRFNFDGFRLHRSFFNQRIEDLEDDTVRALYEDIVYTYMSLIECIDNIGNGKKFYYNSLHAFGTPTEKNVENAKFILHFSDEQVDEDTHPQFSAAYAEEYFREFSRIYPFTYEIRHSYKLSAMAMVLNNEKALVINKNYVFSKNELNVLCNHEIGVHMVTTMNGDRQPLKIFSHGFPNNVETQEGLAVFSEYLSGNLTLRRLKELAYRVIAVDSLAKGYDFVQTFNLLNNGYGLEEHKAFTITLRVHRGGGFTKDFLYLTGLKRVYDYHQLGNDLGLMMTGKVSLEYGETISYLTRTGLAKQAHYKNAAFETNDNRNSLVDFILENLK